MQILQTFSETGILASSNMFPYIRRLNNSHAQKLLYLYDFGGNGTSPKTTQPQPSLSRQKKQWWPRRLDLNIFKPLDAQRGSSYFAIMF